MEHYEYFVCKDPDRWSVDSQCYDCFRTARARAEIHGLYVVEVTYTYEDSELVYDPKEDKDGSE